MIIPAWLGVLFWRKINTQPAVKPDEVIREKE